MHDPRGGAALPSRLMCVAHQAVNTDGPRCHPLTNIRHMPVTMKAARFSAVELVRFSGEGYGAFEARFVAGAGPSSTSTANSKASLAGIDDFVESVADDEYRHVLQDFFEAFAKIDDLTVFWGTTGCSLRVAIPGRSPLSVGWMFPPGPQRWMAAP